MTPTTHPSEPDFDRIARLYRWAEYVLLGPLLERTRTALLDRVRPCRSAFVLGDGDGRFLARLLQANPALQAHAVDTSRAMLQLLRRRCGRLAPGRVTTQHASALDVLPPPDTDLVVTHFFLDCLTEPQLDHLVRATAAALRPGVLWLLSDFAIPPSPAPRAWRLAASAYIRLLYAAFRLVTGLRVTRLPDPQTALTRYGFNRLEAHTSLGGMLYSELWALSSALPESRGSAARHNPLPWATIHPGMASIGDASRFNNGTRTGPPAGAGTSIADPLPDPEPAAPSLPGPDLGVFQPPPRPAAAAHDIAQETRQPQEPS